MYPAFNHSFSSMSMFETKSKVISWLKSEVNVIVAGAVSAFCERN